jgi:4-amino-4-deoxy-L-arabinose transferase-like glycosyltransferase
LFTTKPATESEPEPAEASPRWFRPALALVVVGALVLRVTYVLVARRNFDPHGDAYFYTAGANLLADGKGFISPFFEVVGIHRSAAEHPPAYIIFLAIPSVLGMKSVLTHLLWSCGLGSATVWVIGLLGRAVGGPRAGIVAAFLAAVYPNLWAPDGMLQAETLSMFFAALALLLAYRYWQSPSWQRLTLVGLACGAGAMARSELILLVPFLVVPLVWTTRYRLWRQRVKWLAVSVLAAVIVIAPWTIYNTTRFVHPILLSAQFDPLLASANCDSVYYGRLQGYFDIQCAVAISDKEHLADEEGLPRFDESQEDVVYRREALDYVRGHLSRLPEVEGVRLLRIVGLYKTSLYVRADAFIEGRNPVWISWAALYSFWLLALLAIGGGVVMRRRRAVPVFPLIAPIVVVFVTVVVTYASTRFRTTAEPAFVVLAAVAIDAGIQRVVGRGGRAGRDGNAYASARN